eukprot:1783723-Rhodomonas_salina.1
MCIPGYRCQRRHHDTSSMWYKAQTPSQPEAIRRDRDVRDGRPSDFGGGGLRELEVLTRPSHPHNLHQPFSHRDAL